MSNIETLKLYHPNSSELFAEVNRRAVEKSADHLVDWRSYHKDEYATAIEVNFIRFYDRSDSIYRSKYEYVAVDRDKMLELEAALVNYNLVLELMQSEVLSDLNSQMWIDTQAYRYIYRVGWDIGYCRIFSGVDNLYEDCSGEEEPVLETLQRKIL